MNRKLSRLAFLIFLFMIPFDCLADAFNGSKSLKGYVGKIIEINHFKIRKDVAPETVGLPERFIIDLKNNVVRPSKDSVIRKVSKINRVEHIENKLVLQGFEDGVANIDDGLAWSMVISKLTGQVVLTASGDGVAYVVFGTCTADEDN